MKNRFLAAAVIALVFLVGGVVAQTRSMTVTIADGKVPCRFNESQQCLAFLSSETKEWYAVDVEIRGFNFIPGVTQTIVVRYTPKREATPEPGSLDWRYVRTTKKVKTDGKTGAEAVAQVERRTPPVLAGRNWTLVSMDARPVEISEIVLRFDNNSQRFGIRICNQMGGQYEQSGFDLKMTEVVSTQMACRDPQSSVEGRFRELLPKITRAQTYEGKLALFAGNAKVLEFVERVALEDVRWAIVEVDGKKVATSGDIPYLLLSKVGSGLTGFTGCNQLFGKFTRDGNRLKFTEVAMTKMACTEDDVMGVEIGVMDSLEKIDRFEIKNGVLTLFAGSLPRLRLSVVPN